MDNLDVKAVWARAKTYNEGSESNGGLMRITPLAVWCHNLSEEELKRAVENEDSLTHSNKNAQAASYLYCLCIKYLIENPGNRELAFENVK
jgi:ADP-ribosylglycohydrolase